MTATDRSRWLRRLRPWCALAVTLATVVAIVRAAASGVVPDLATIRWPWAAGALLAAIVTNNVLCGLRWRLFTPAGASPAWAVQRYTEAAFWGLLLPFGGDVYRAFGGRAMVDAVVTDRLLSGLLLVASALLAATAAALPTFGVVALAGGVLVASSGWLVLRPRLVATAWPSAGRLLAASALTGLYVLGTAATLLLAVHAAGADMSTAEAVVAAPIVLAAGAAPSVAGLSPGLLAAGWFLQRAGASAAQTATAVAVFVGAALCLVLLGGLAIVARRLAPARGPIATEVTP